MLRGAQVLTHPMRRLLKRGKLEQESGIPLASVGEEYEIYKITTKSKLLSKKKLSLKVK